MAYPIKTKTSILQGCVSLPLPDLLTLWEETCAGPPHPPAQQQGAGDTYTCPGQNHIRTPAKNVSKVNDHSDKYDQDQVAGRGSALPHL